MTPLIIFDNSSALFVFEWYELYKLGFIFKKLDCGFAERVYAVAFAADILGVLQVAAAGYCLFLLLIEYRWVHRNLVYYPTKLSKSQLL